MKLLINLASQNLFYMEGENIYPAAYTGSKQFTQHDVQTANASGFGAAADDYMERGIDLNEQLIRNKPATYFFKMNNDAMEPAHICINDILIVDRSIKASNGKIIVASVNGELVVRRYHQSFNKALLIADNKRYKDISIDEFTQFHSWGVIIYAIHPLTP
jgi:DNA polymerase V